MSNSEIRLYRQRSLSLLMAALMQSSCQKADAKRTGRGQIGDLLFERGCSTGKPVGKSPALPRPHNTLASVLSLSSNSSTSATFLPPALAGGSSTFKTCNRGARSTPKESALMTSIGFFFAFMRFGSVAYRGSFKRRSAEMTAGTGMRTSWMPASTSRATVIIVLVSSKVTWEADPACGQPRRPARIEAVCPASLSMACLPSNTSVGFSFATIFSSSFATERDCNSWSVRMLVCR
mmetsp:Transcript_63633/g.125902  ORF Transcript_63633/g.125902 Transcript_63633/m.125902 type:complete len:235 (+) Transcript_63633:200-904(+)